MTRIVLTFVMLLGIALAIVSVIWLTAQLFWLGVLAAVTSWLAEDLRQAVAR